MIILLKRRWLTKRIIKRIRKKIIKRYSRIQKIQINKSRINRIILNIKYKEYFSFAFLISYLELSISNDTEPLTQFSFGILIVFLIVLCYFTNVIGYLSVIL